MKLIVAPEIFSLFPNLRILVLVASLPALDAAQTAARDALIRSRWRSAWSRLASTEKPASHPNVKAFKDAMKGAGIKVSSFPPAIESLVKRVKPGSKPFEVNFLVDFYNANSLDNVLPSGAFDLDELRRLSPGSDIHLRKTVDGDTYQALDAPEPTPLPSGEISYLIGSTAITRHFIWRQSKQALIHTESRDFMIVAEFVQGIGKEAQEGMEKSLVDGFREVFGVEVKRGMITGEQREVELI